MKYHGDRQECTINLFRFRELLDALPEGTKEEVWKYYVLNKHCKTVEEKIAEGMYIWNNYDQHIYALNHNVKSNMTTIKHQTQSTKSGVQGIALYSANGRRKVDSSAISTIRSICLYPLHARLATVTKKK